MKTFPKQGVKSMELLPPVCLAAWQGRDTSSRRAPASSFLTAYACGPP